MENNLSAMQYQRMGSFETSLYKSEQVKKNPSSEFLDTQGTMGNCHAHGLWAYLAEQHDMHVPLALDMQFLILSEWKKTSQFTLDWIFHGMLSVLATIHGPWIHLVFPHDGLPMRTKPQHTQCTLSCSYKDMLLSFHDCMTMGKSPKPSHWHNYCLPIATTSPNYFIGLKNQTLSWGMQQFVSLVFGVAIAQQNCCEMRRKLQHIWIIAWHPPSWGPFYILIDCSNLRGSYDAYQPTDTAGWL